MHVCMQTCIYVRMPAILSLLFFLSVIYGSNALLPPGTFPKRMAMAKEPPPLFIWTLTCSGFPLLCSFYIYVKYIWNSIKIYFDYFLGSIKTDFGPLLSSLPGEELTLVCWDPPGYGQSRPPPRKFSNDFLRKDATLAAQMMKVCCWLYVFFLLVYSIVTYFVRIWSMLWSAN